jgi:catechol 2,3-dioxygenase-like lactoylglutathione lyase family enzyme
MRRLRTMPRLGAHHQASDGAFSAAMPILPVQDLARTEAFYLLLGFTVTLRHPDYLIMQAGPAEIHFGREEAPVPASCYLDTPDAGRIWKQLRSNDIQGLSPVEDHDYGMREFVITDPDGNRLRVGSPIPD